MPDGQELQVVSSKPLPDLSVVSSTDLPDSGPSTYSKLTAGYNPKVEEWAQKHPVVGPIVRFLDATGGALMATPETMVKGIAAAVKSGAEQTPSSLQLLGKPTVDIANSPLAQAAKATKRLWSDPEYRSAVLSILPEALGQGTGNVAGSEVVPAALGSTAAAVTSKLPGAGKVAQRLYQSALKPSTTLEPAERAAILKTGLENKIPVSEEGANKIASTLQDLQNQVKSTIATNPNAPISKFAVASRLNQTAARAANQVTPVGDLNAISKTGNEFLKTQPASIPAEQAQALKTGTYQSLGNKSFGELKGATVEAQKSLARGLKEELESKFPELKDLNAQQSKLFDLAVPINRAIGRINNHELLGIGTPIAGEAVATISGNANLGRAVATMKAVMTPEVKSKLAIAINAASKGKISLGAANARVAAYAASLAGQDND